MQKVIFDACTYSNFVLAEAFWVLEKLFKNELVMTYLVKQEIEKGFSRHPKLMMLNNHVANRALEILTVTYEQELALMAELPNVLSDADKSCIAVAQKRQQIIASDDECLSREAKNLRIKVIGTTKIISMAIENKILKCREANDLLERMQKEANFFTSKRF